MLISVIIVSWNAQDYLVECLESLTSAVSQYPLEIIVVDNASTDGSPEIVEQRFPHVQMIRTGSNLGFAKANNIGVARSTGTHLAFINSDVKVLPDCLTRLADFIESHPRAGLISPRIIGGDGKLQRTVRGFPGVWNMFCRAASLDVLFPKTKLFTGHTLTHWSQETLAQVDILGGCFWLARRAALTEVGLLDESFFMYGEDMDWCRRYRAAGWELYFVPSAEAIHYGGGSSANAPVRFYIERQRADLQYWKKHHSRLAVTVYFMISGLHLILRTLGYSLVYGLRKRQRDTYRHKIDRSVASLKWLLFGVSPLTAKTNHSAS